METCAECDKVAVSNCVICGKPLCQNHILHGLSKRNIAPAVNCANCQKKFPRKLRKNIIIMTTVFIIASIFLIYYLSTIIPFLF
ncbi:hypothetical protein LCGC14_0690600 [marine sediment metagenome]|uniref:B box-type domain-containing protein n=1 Tax=marine sediment metagenome TaxID=412755 RepID=A0A0F9T6T1_9ZZZZ|nr:hypothetical protein [bacterium]